MTTGEQSDPAIDELSAHDHHSIDDPDPAVAAALATARGWVGDDVSIVGLGETDAGDPCVLVHAVRDVDLPDHVEGVPVVVVRDDEVHALEDDDSPE